MTLLAAVVGGLACGSMLGWRWRTIGLWLAVWAAMLVVQTLVVVEGDHVTDWSYWPVQAAILLVGLGLIWLGAMVRRWRTRRTLSPPAP